jgi:NAD(P)-dependent dehydrogenase (short-subunit alcohol dehydrogenase family)
MAARYDLSDRVALVTGGARGIGFETARALVSRGASVVVVDLDAVAAEAAAAQLHDTKTLGVAADVTDRGALQRAVAETVDRFGGLDVVVANAGIASRGATFRAMATEGFERVVDVNLMGVVWTVQAALPEIVRRRGHAVVIASVYAFMNGAGAIPYAISKAAVEQFGRALRLELAQHGASASVAYFGFIDTELVHRMLDQDPVLRPGLEAFPRPLRKRLQPRVAGEAIVQGIERRAPRIIRPRRWALLSALRGVIGPAFDARGERDAEIQHTLRELDARAGEEQPTSA